MLVRDVLVSTTDIKLSNAKPITLNTHLNKDTHSDIGSILARCLDIVVVTNTKELDMKFTYEDKHYVVPFGSLVEIILGNVLITNQEPVIEINELYKEMY